MSLAEDSDYISFPLIILITIHFANLFIFMAIFIIFYLCHWSNVIVRSIHLLPNYFYAISWVFIVIF